MATGAAPGSATRAELGEERAVAGAVGPRDSLRVGRGGRPRAARPDLEFTVLLLVVDFWILLLG